MKKFFWSFSEAEAAMGEFDEESWDQQSPKPIGDEEGRYDIDGQSLEDGVIYIASDDHSWEKQGH